MKKSITSGMLMLLLAVTFVSAAPMNQADMEANQSRIIAQEMLQNGSMNQERAQERVVLNQSEFKALGGGGRILSPEQGFGERLMNVFEQKNVIRVSEEQRFLGIFKMERELKYTMDQFGDITRQRSIIDYLFKEGS